MKISLTQWTKPWKSHEYKLFPSRAGRAVVKCTYMCILKVKQWKWIHFLKKYTIHCTLYRTLLICQWWGTLLRACKQKNQVFDRTAFMKIGVLGISWDYGIGQWSKRQKIILLCFPLPYLILSSRRQFKSLFYPEPLGLFHLNLVQIIFG